MSIYSYKLAHVQVLFRQVSTWTDCYQLPIFRCTNVHPWRYARPMFRCAIFRWRHESQWANNNNNQWPCTRHVCFKAFILVKIYTGHLLKIHLGSKQQISLPSGCDIQIVQSWLQSVFGKIFKWHLNTRPVFRCFRHHFILSIPILLQY